MVNKQGVNESTAYRIIRKIEDVLVTSRAFSLPGKKKLSSCDYQVEIVVVDVTESPVERPKKNKNMTGISEMNCDSGRVRKSR